SCAFVGCFFHLSALSLFYSLSLHDALPIFLVTPRVIQAMAADGLFIDGLARLHPRYRTPAAAITLQGIWALILVQSGRYGALLEDRKSTRLNSSHVKISYAVFCLKKKKPDH